LGAAHDEQLRLDPAGIEFLAPFGGGDLTVGEPVCLHADIALLGRGGKRCREVGGGELHGDECA
jgi:hypothetical protein